MFVERPPVCVNCAQEYGSDTRLGEVSKRLDRSEEALWKTLKLLDALLGVSPFWPMPDGTTTCHFCRGYDPVTGHMPGCPYEAALAFREGCDRHAREAPGRMEPPLVTSGESPSESRRPECR